MNIQESTSHSIGKALEKPLNALLIDRPGPEGIKRALGWLTDWAAHYFFPHRFAAAFAAICDRFFGDSAAARAAPPFSPPRRPRATACGFFVGSTGFSTGAFGSNFGASPMDSRKT